MRNSDLPQEILLEIFSKLPTKSVGRCRTLSKYWKTHLSTTNFIKKHLISRKQTEYRKENVALVTRENMVYIISRQQTKKDEVFNSKSLPGKWFCVLGSCNGLILLAGYRKMLLVNPITLKQVTIQTPQLTKLPQDLGFCVSINYGFGYDSCADDYKIVRMCSFSPKNADGLAKTLVDVYYVKNGVWKTVDVCYPYSGLVPKKYAFEGGAFVNGVVHWLICSKGGYRSCIAAFDLGNEVFREIPLPKDFVRRLGYEANGLTRLRRGNGLSVVGGCLSIVDNYGNGAADVWIMKEYAVAESWVRFHIEDEDIQWHSIVATLCYVEDGELLCITNWDYLFACDLKGGTMKEVVLGGCDDCFAHGMAFVDSLVSPGGSL